MLTPIHMMMMVNNVKFFGDLRVGHWGSLEKYSMKYIHVNHWMVF